MNQNKMYILVLINYYKNFFSRGVPSLEKRHVDLLKEIMHLAQFQPGPPLVPKIVAGSSGRLEGLPLSRSDISTFWWDSHVLP